MTAQPRIDSRPAARPRRNVTAVRPAPRLRRTGFALPTVREIPRRAERESLATW